MNFLTRIDSMSDRELHALQDVVLQEIQRRKCILLAVPDAEPEPAACEEVPAVPFAKRRPAPLSPRRRAA